MSTFAVSLERIATVWPHDNADRLAMAQLASMSYQFVIPKDTYQPGDLVVYFPIDSILPEPLIAALGLTGKLSGVEKNRIKTLRLRGAISQGIVAKPETVIPDWTPQNAWQEGDDITELLGVTRYDPPPMVSEAGVLVRMPPMVSVYDIEGAERFAAQVETYLMDQPVIITEKLEGSHWSISLLADGAIAVCRRHYRIQPDPEIEHDWFKVARVSGIRDKLPAIKAFLEERMGRALRILTLRGEVIGPSVQGNIYALRERQVWVFEVEANGQPIDAPLYVELVEKFQIVHAPILANGVTLRAWLAGRTVAEASNGASLLNTKTLREGIVIRPLIEARNEALGRVIIKQRSPEYLAGSEN